MERPDLMRGDSFRASRRTSRDIALLTAGLLAVTVVAIAVGPGFDASSADLWKAGLAIGGLVLMLSIFTVLFLRPPVILRVGPEGLQLPLGFAQPIAWRDIRRVRRPPGTRTLWERRSWIVVELRDGVVPNYRFSAPVWLELWYLRRFGLRIPLHALGDPPDVVVASIERFFPVEDENAER